MAWSGSGRPSTVSRNACSHPTHAGIARVAGFNSKGAGEAQGITPGQTYLVGMIPVLLLPVLLALAPGGPTPKKEARMELQIPAFSNGGTIPRAHTADGPDRSPALHWGDPPSGTQAFALIVDDPEAPVGTWVHWVLYDLPGTARSLAEDQPRTADLPGGTHQGKNSWGRLGWNGPSPPPGKPHRYFFRLIALSVPLGLPAGATRGQVDAAVKGKVLAEATWMGTYGR
jgi:Raf kinase inhibitor-like YbhB/YbcL family protein